MRERWSSQHVLGTARSNLARARPSSAPRQSTEAACGCTTGSNDCQARTVRSAPMDVPHRQGRRWQACPEMPSMLGMDQRSQICGVVTSLSIAGSEVKGRTGTGRCPQKVQMAFGAEPHLTGNCVGRTQLLWRPWYDRSGQGRDSPEPPLKARKSRCGSTQTGPLSR